MERLLQILTLTIKTSVKYDDNGDINVRKWKAVSSDSKVTIVF